MVARYKLKMTNEDFRVTEVSLIPQLKDKNYSTYSYILLCKSGYTTFEAQTRLKNFFSLEYTDVSAEGLKDEDAITSQIISIKKKISQSSIKRFNEQNSGDKYIKITQTIGHGSDPVMPGVLHGNCFRVILRGLSPNIADKLNKYCKENHSFNFVNYYDSQRFGTPGNLHNTHIIGKNIIENNWAKALRELIKSNNEEAKDLKKIKIKNSDQVKEIMLGCINPNKIRFFVKSYCSFLWNNALSDHIAQNNKVFGYKFKYIGDLMLPENNVFMVNSAFECPGYAYSASDQIIKEKVMRRTSVVYTTINTEDVTNDSYNQGKKCLALNFFLPTGSYGTMLIRQLFLRMEIDEKRD